MKKLFALLFVAALATLVACGPSAEEIANQKTQDSLIEQARIDSIAAVEAAAAQAIADSIQAVEAAAADTIIKAEE